MVNPLESIFVAMVERKFEDHSSDEYPFAVCSNLQLAWKAVDERKAQGQSDTLSRIDYRVDEFILDGPRKVVNRHYR